MRISLVLPLLLGMASHASIVMAQSAGTFTATGSIATPRAFHTATLFFSATGNLIGNHVCHQAMLLNNGKVLIAGGSVSGAEDRVPNAELPVSR